MYEDTFFIVMAWKAGHAIGISRLRGLLTPQNQQDNPPTQLIITFWAEKKFVRSLSFAFDTFRGIPGLYALDASSNPSPIENISRIFKCSQEWGLEGLLVSCSSCLTFVNEFESTCTYGNPLNLNVVKLNKPLQCSYSLLLGY